MSAGPLTPTATPQPEISLWSISMFIANVPAGVGVDPGPLQLASSVGGLSLHVFSVNQIAEVYPIAQLTSVGHRGPRGMAVSHATGGGPGPSMRTPLMRA